MFYYAVLALHVIVCIFLVLVVLLQSGKGADLAGAFGGGATQTAFGSRGPASFLTRMTTAVAVIFMVTSISLAMMGDRRATTSDRSILDERATTPVQEQQTDTNVVPTSVPTPEQIEEQIKQIQEQQQSVPEEPAQ
jgi:preprotein translocase subunit SecG